MQQLSHIPMLAISLFLMFTLLALSNLLLISIYEQDSDRQDGHRSFVLSYGLHRSRQVINCALVAFYSCLLLTYLCMPSLGLFAMIILLLMGLGLHLIKAKPALFQKNDKYRVLADMIFLLPAIYLLLS
jgi:4-hydroxybenzoate polyprenyltransferase